MVDLGRKDQTAAAASLRFIAVGQSVIKRDLAGDSARGFRELEAILRSADIAFTNFEGTIRGSYRGWPTKKGKIHASDPAVLDSLKALGFNTLSLSNNHAFDLGPEGVLSTLEEVKKRGFLYAGIGKDRTEASRPGIVETQKGRIALVSMDCSPQPDSFYADEDRPGMNRLQVIESLMLDQTDYDRLKEISRKIGYERQKAEYIRYGFRTSLKDIQEFYGIRFEHGRRTRQRRIIDEGDFNRHLAAIRNAAREADFLIVYAHHHYWELPWEKTPDWFGHFARRCIDAGANAFVSHGVPLLQGIEIYNSRPIFYSLGNFIFHSDNREAYRKDSIWQSVVAACEFDGQGKLLGADFYPISLGGEEALRDPALSRDVPHLEAGEYGEGILRRLGELSAPYDTKIEIKDGCGILVV